ncbi:putative bacterial ABC-type protein transporter [Helianthus annuus]|nr:putative bacterial ABC-type protein transporter [Helianthus annuus]KAJ0459950.1 putative bacterial ABC-type protein transporter [Helianthus annuus]
MTDNDIYTTDGTVTLKNERAIRSKTGNWKACPFILGTIYILVHSSYLFEIMFMFIEQFIVNFVPFYNICTFIVIGNECCERLAYYGMSTNLVNYLSDRLNQGSVRASTNVSNWSGTCYATPLLGAFLADAYLGRYWTIASFSIIYFIVSRSPSCFRYILFKIPLYQVLKELGKVSSLKFKSQTFR